MVLFLARLRLCVSSCEDKEDGDYQSCKSCGVYASCVAGKLFDERPCPSGLRWDNIAKKCLRRSRTCWRKPAHLDKKGNCILIFVFVIQHILSVFFIFTVVCFADSADICVSFLLN